MGWFDKRKPQSFEVGELSDSQIRDVLKKKKAPMISPKEMRKMDKEAIKKTVGEKGFGALQAAAQENRQRRFERLERDMRSGSDPHALTRMKSEDPRRYEQLLDREAKRQGLI